MVRATTLARISAFLAVAETLNFRRAAEQLGIAQPALSRGVRQLEEELGFELLSRTTRRVALTPAGEVLFRDGAVGMSKLAQVCARAQSVAQGLSGSLMVGYSTFASVGPMADIIIEFRKQYTDAHVGLRLLASSEQAAAFEQGALDLGFIMSAVVGPSLNSIVVSREHMVAMVPAGHHFSARRALFLKELAEEPLVLGSENRWRGFRSLVHKVFAERNLGISIAEEADDLPVLLQLVRLGFGCTLLPASFIPTLPPGISAIELIDLTETLDVSLAWRDDNLSSLAARFIDVARRIIPPFPGPTRGAAALK